MGMWCSKGDGLGVTAYTGDRAILLAFDLAEDRLDRFAGFSVACTFPGADRSKTGEYFLPNRLNFGTRITSKTPFGSAQWTGSDKAPFQTFHWTHYPSTGPGRYIYTVYAAYFSGNGGATVTLGPSVSVAVDLVPDRQGPVDIGFTRSMVSSQAYVNRFRNAPLHPVPQTMDFDTAGYIGQYVWLGAHAREAVMAFLEKCLADPVVTLDIFSFDFDEPDIIRAVCRLGSRARVYQDNSQSHCSKESAEADMRGSASAKTDLSPPREPATVTALRQAGVTVRAGNFSGLSHNKVMIRRRQGVAEAVLAGSANFTVRGLYVQANSVLVFEDPQVAGLYARAFDQAWNDPGKFRTSPIAKGWHDVSVRGARYSFSFAPHRTAFPLDTIAESIAHAEHSVLFAMMQMRGSGAAIDAITALPEREDLFSMGIIQLKAQLRLFKPDTGKENFTAVSHAYLAKDVPPPFDAEISGGFGQVIHHKVVVCDFNAADPVVFCGSSNLAAGGETRNGDNLIAIHDRDVAVRYAVETIRLYDHFRFRSLRESSTAGKTLQLQTTPAWAEPYYNPCHIRFRERCALAGKNGP